MSTKKAKPGDNLFTMHFEEFTKLVWNRNNGLTHEPVDFQDDEGVTNSFTKVIEVDSDSKAKNMNI
ncbi:5378_t:CDS:2 [Paraglomus brasilianum]|uniref:5378_t:CDS:1 n=1 Tax=Paraglomus brasilianum TaxID=144538 RepID=A0A9N9G6T4_9GLOM|nr:5378_t:CDS:2 [Paraglomus brasilianum]